MNCESLVDRDGMWVGGKLAAVVWLLLALARLTLKKQRLKDTMQVLCKMSHDFSASAVFTLLLRDLVAAKTPTPSLIGIRISISHKQVVFNTGSFRVLSAAKG